MILKIIRSNLKNQFFNGFALLSALLFLIYFNYSCNKNSITYPQTYDFKPEYQKGRAIYKQYKIDLDNDKLYEFILLTCNEKSKTPVDTFYNFDLIELFRWNQFENQYTKSLSDTVYFGKNIDTIIITRDSLRSILLITDSGGEDLVNSIGLKIYRHITEKGITKLFDCEMGNPELIDINNDNNYELIQHKSITSKLTADKPVFIVSDILILKNEKYISAINNFPGYTDKLFSIDSLNYYSIKQNKKSENTEIFSGIIKLLLSIKCQMNAQYSNYLWKSEEKYIKDRFKQIEFLNLLNCLSAEGFETGEEINSQLSDLKTLAYDLINKKKYDEAIKTFENILLIDPEDIDSYLQIGEILYFKGLYNEALSYLLQASMFYIENKRLFLNIGKCYEKLNNDQECLNYYKKYLLYDSVSTEASRIKLYIKQKNNI